MPKYNIEASRVVYYLVEQLEATDAEDASRKVIMEDLPSDIETWAVDWGPIEVEEVEEVEDWDLK